MIRSTLFNIVFWTGFAGYLTIIYPFALFFSQKQTAIIVYRRVTEWMLFCLKYIADINYEAKNINILKEQVKNGPVIIGCNHQSSWETLIFSIMLDEIAIVVKKELLSVPIAGLYFKRLDCIPINRASPISSIKSILKYGKIAYEKKRSILIFPNGTRSSIDDHIEYKSGVFALYNSLKIPVIPVSVDSGKCWPRRSFKKKKGTIRLEFKDPIFPGLSKPDFWVQFEKSI